MTSRSRLFDLGLLALALAAISPAGAKAAAAAPRADETCLTSPTSSPLDLARRLRSLTAGGFVDPAQAGLADGQCCPPCRGGDDEAADAHRL